MSKPKKNRSESKELTVVERAVVALGYTTETEKELATLAGSTTHITAITNSDGREQAHGALMVLRNTRVAIQKRGKDARDDATKFSKAVIAEENRLIGIIEAEENRLQALRDGWDQAIEAERQAKVQAELDRVAGIEQRIQDMRATVLRAALCTKSDQVADLMSTIDGVVIDDTFAESIDIAADVKAEVYQKLSNMLDAFVAREAEAKRLAEERAELDRQRAEQIERDRAAENIRRGLDEIRANPLLTVASGQKAIATEIARIAKLCPDARVYGDRHQEALALQVTTLRSLEELHGAAKNYEAEQARLAEQQAAQAAQAEVLRKAADELAAAQRAEQERKDREEQARRDAEETARRNAEAEDLRRARETFVPTLDQVVEVLADHFEVTNDRVLEWLDKIANPSRKAA